MGLDFTRSRGRRKEGWREERNQSTRATTTLHRKTQQKEREGRGAGRNDRAKEKREGREEGESLKRKTKEGERRKEV